MPTKEIPKDWVRRLQAMKRFNLASELAKEQGAPAHKVRQGELEIWHYPLGVLSGILYSIRVAVQGDEALQIYMGMDPTQAPDTAPAPKSWWLFW